MLDDKFGGDLSWVATAKAELRFASGVLCAMGFTSFRGDPNVADEAAGTTPLIAAAREGKVEIVQALMDKTADLMKTDLDGDSPLMVAISQNHMQVVPCLHEPFLNMACTCLYMP